MTHRAKAVVILIAFVVACAVFETGRGAGSGVLTVVGGLGAVICMFVGFWLLFSKGRSRRG